jgi:LmbE family N-acetylglucosaminyl deacetylase
MTSSDIMVVATHPDDETLGCGGTLLRRKAEGARLHWTIMTEMTAASGYSEAVRARRENEIGEVAARYGFSSVTRVGAPAGALETMPIGPLIEAVGAAIKAYGVDTLYAPFPGDAHTDHRVTFDVVSACAKWFRYPSVKRLYVCEILSETDAAVRPDILPFRPNVYVDITPHLDEKIDVMRLYAGEMRESPFPRSERLIRAAALSRGSQAGVEAAESFMLLRSVE